MDTFETFCRDIFYGSSARSLRARYVLLGLDMAILAYFVTTTFMPLESWIVAVDVVIGCVLLAELAGRFIADSDRLGLLSKPLTVVDVVIIVSLFMPAVIGNFAFLRILRSVRVLRSYLVMRELLGHSRLLRRNEEVVFSALNLVMFIFIVTAFVFVLQNESNPGINNYVDALYFTITTLTTTGFGDITLVGSSGRLLAVAIMIVGVAHPSRASDGPARSVTSARDAASRATSSMPCTASIAGASCTFARKARARRPAGRKDWRAP